MPTVRVDRVETWATPAWITQLAQDSPNFPRFDDVKVEAKGGGIVVVNAKIRMPPIPQVVFVAELDIE